MENNLNTKIEAIKRWLGTGSVNIFGLPMSGKDTVGVKLAEAIGGKFLSSGLIIRSMEAIENKNLTGGGKLLNTDTFYEWVLPYFNKPELDGYPLVLSSIGRWSGEENMVINKAKRSNHEIKAAVVLNISEAEVTRRWEKVPILKDRDGRNDDSSIEVFQTRLMEFREKTLPVLLHYRQMGLLVDVNANMERDEVFVELINKLYSFSQKKIMESRNLRSEESFF